ncbi:hypothetical protein CVT24_006751 [Panaeolus cyanescens]|uniref:Rho-GAP domain-containing protein n=1 Tax=Panaeolus cyanescens TaxID=181874 RepID=A0A409V9D9_9AGAR|nr:hypothetical protein CVT24_006751 [Panaeolus cyanescens]
MAVLSLPLTFTNSFWTQDYRKGLEVLYAKLEQGVAENDEIVAFVRARAAAERQLATSLTNPAATGRADTGFSADDGASLLMAFRGLQKESAVQGQIHATIANELSKLVADPFDDWAQGYKERLKQNKANVIDNWLRTYEQAQTEVAKLKEQYLTKVRRADDAEDDAKFAPGSGGPTDKYTSSPRLRPTDAPRAPPQRTASVSDRIAQRLKEIQKKSIDAISNATSEISESPELLDEKPLPKVDKGKGREVDAETTGSSTPSPMSPLSVSRELSGSPMPDMPPPPILLAGLALPPSAVSQLLSRAAAELPLRSVQFPLLGTYQDAFTGEEFVAWLRDNVQGFGGSLDIAEQAAKELTEKENLLRRLGELGNQLENSDDAWYQFRPKAFELGTVKAESQTAKSQDKLIKSLKTNNLVNLVSKALNANSNGEPVYIRARQEAEEADQTYRVAVRRLDRHRLALEERIEDSLKLLQRWETERLRAVKTVLLQYQGTLQNVPKSFEPSLERSATLIAAYQPESDLTALIERYRTGPFRPDPQIYESVAHDESDVVFGIDLRKWAEGGWYALTQGEQKKDLVPPVLTAMLNGLDAAYERVPNDLEKRKSWIYEVPLPVTHHLREALNAVPPEQPFSLEMFSKFDAPVIASCVKLWALELHPPLGLYEGWEEFRRLYPTVGSAPKEENEELHLQNVSTALQKLPRVHLYTLDAILKHLKNLIETTKVDEADDVFFTKLALSMGRTILKPKFETEISIQDRHPTLLFIDLLKHYDALLPPTIARKKRESERRLPIRKRTAPVDMRLSRSRISMGADAQQLLAAQRIAQNPSLAKPTTKSPELPALPPPPAAVEKSQPAQPVEPAQSTPPPPPPPPVIEREQTPQPPTLPPVVPTPPIPQAVLPTPPPPPPVLAPPPPPPPFLSSEGRPSFKEPPPEFDDLPPRPMFKEPAPEVDDLPARPTFVDPPAEETESLTPPPPPPAAAVPVVPPPPPPSTAVIPPTPQRRGTRGSIGSASPSHIASRSPSPAASDPDIVLGSGKTSISRSGSNQASGVMRGPRTTRGPRGSGNVQNLVQNLNRNSVSGAPVAPAQTSPKLNRFSGGAPSPVRRPSSVVGRSAAAFSRRTMASDAEDDVVDRK